MQNSIKHLHNETQSWGIEIVRTELKEIDPPKDVQETMNKVVKAENEKIAAIDSATAAETVADGDKTGKDQRSRRIINNRKYCMPKEKLKPLNW